VLAILHSPTPRKMIQRPIMVQCLLLVLFLVLYLMYLIWIASSVNEEYMLHRYLRSILRFPTLTTLCCRQYLTMNALKIESELSALLIGEQDRMDDDSKLRSAASCERLLYNSPFREGSSGNFFSDRNDTEERSKTPTPYRNPGSNKRTRISWRQTLGNEWLGDESREDLKQGEQPEILHEGITRYQLFEYDESIKALRRSMEAIDISNQQWNLQICGFTATKALLFSVLSGCFLFISTIYTALKQDARTI
jgi:hypothetical protein